MIVNVDKGHTWPQLRELFPKINSEFDPRIYLACSSLWDDKFTAEDRLLILPHLSFLDQRGELLLYVMECDLTNCRRLISASFGDQKYRVKLSLPSNCSWLKSLVVGKNLRPNWKKFSYHKFNIIDLDLSISYGETMREWECFPKLRRLILRNSGMDYTTYGPRGFEMPLLDLSCLTMVEEVKLFSCHIDVQCPSTWPGRVFADPYSNSNCLWKGLFVISANKSERDTLSCG